MLKVQSVVIEGWHLRGRAALAASCGAADPEPLLRAAERAAKVIARTEAPWGLPLASCLRAGIAHRRGDPERERAALDAALAGFIDADMALFAAAVRQRLGALIGGDEGAGHLAAAAAAMEAAKVAAPERMTDLLLPGWAAVAAPAPA